MFRATDGIVLPTTVIGSLPRPAWYTENLGTRRFREAMVNAIEQRLSMHGLQLLDADGDLRSRLPHGKRLVELHGFGAQVGVGHLNNAGHRAYSALLTELITTLSAGQKRSERE